MAQSIRTTILILNYNGISHLKRCLLSLEQTSAFAASTVSPHRDEVWVVDNGSNDGSAAMVEQFFPWVTWLPLGRNRGFSDAYNHAASKCSSDWLVFLNNDTRVSPQWLAALHAVTERHPEAHAVASRMMNWDGSRVDFAGADTYFFGHARQADQGEPWNPAAFPERQLLFGCAGAILFRRETFLNLGGFDPDYFSFGEDVDLGWRATCLGFPTWFAPEAVVYHRLHGSWGLQSPVRIRSLIERNALCTVLKNFEAQRSGVLLLAAAVLTFLRTWAWFERTADDPFITADGLAHLKALADFGELLPRMLQRRDRIQERRCHSDREILPLFGSFASPPLPHKQSYRDAYSRVCDSLEISEHHAGIPDWPEDLNRLARHTVRTLSGCCRELFSESLPGSCFHTEAPHPEWEYPLSGNTQIRLSKLASLANKLIEDGISDMGAAQRFCSRLEDYSGERRCFSSSATRATSKELVSFGSRSEGAEKARVSLIVRTKDRLESLGRALRSIADQSRPPWEVIVVNDGGRDPRSVLETLQERLAIRLVSISDTVGRPKAAQIGLEVAEGVLIGFLDDDDTLLPNHLETLVSAMDTHGIPVVYSDVECLEIGRNQDGIEIPLRRVRLGGPFEPWRLYFENTIPIMAVLAQKDLVIEAGGFRPEFEIFEDWDLWLRLSRLTPFHHCPVITATYMVFIEKGHGQSLQGRHRFPYMARLWNSHHEFIEATCWPRFYQQVLEPLRNRLASVEEELEIAKRNQGNASLLSRLHRFAGRAARRIGNAWR